MPLMVGGLVVLLLAIALFYLLFSARGRYVDGAAGLATDQSQLQRLSSRGVFPSEANVQTMGQQLEIYQKYLDGLYSSMREGQVAATTEMNRDIFRKTLEDVLRQLVNDARAKSVALPADFAFGFQRYVAGNPPADEEMGRLVDQLQSIKTLCEILYDAGISELTAVDRAVFEKDAQVAPVEEEFNRRSLRNRPDAAAPAPNAELFKDPDGLFTKEHYVLSYRAQDAANWKVLDQLSKGAPFAVMTKVEISNPARPAVVPPKTEEKVVAAPNPVSTSGWQAPQPRGEAPGEKKEAEILPRELRVVAGQELPNVRLEVDLYRFVEPASVAEKGEVSP